MGSAEPFAVLLISGGHERAHYAFMLLATAAAMGRPSVLFATNEGCRALAADAAAIAGRAAEDDALRARGVAALQDLRAACVELGVRLLACDTGLRIAALEADSLLPSVEVAGLPTLLDAARGGQIVTV